MMTFARGLMKEVSQKYIQAYFEDIRRLNVVDPSEYPRLCLERSPSPRLPVSRLLPTRVSQYNPNSIVPTPPTALMITDVD